MSAPGAPRILQVCGPRTGGAAEHVARLSLALHGAGWDIEVAGPPGSPFLERVRAGGLAAHELPLTRRPGRSDAAAARLLRALVRERGPALVHAHSSKAGALARIAPIGGVPIVYTPHCFAFAAGFDRHSRLTYAAVEQLLVWRADAVVAVSAWEHATAARALRGLSTRLVLIRHGVPDTEDAVAPPAITAWARGAPVVGYVGRLEEEKGPQRFVRAFARACAEPGFAARGLLVGEGTLSGALAAHVARLGLGDRLRCAPYDGHMGRWLAALDLLVLPSRWESLPIAVLEAMRAGVPVLATRVGGMAEAVTDGVTGRLVPFGDERALVRALVELSGDPATLARMRRAARTRAETDFSIARMVTQTAALYRTLLDGAGSGRRLGDAVPARTA